MSADSYSAVVFTVGFTIYLRVPYSRASTLDSNPESRSGTKERRRRAIDELMEIAYHESVAGTAEMAVLTLVVL